MSRPVMTSRLSHQLAKRAQRHLRSLPRIRRSAILIAAALVAAFALLHASKHTRLPAAMQVPPAVPPSNHTPNALFDRKYDAPWCLQHDVHSRRQQPFARIAYFVQIGNASVPLLSRLFARIHSPHNYYVVHVDAKTPLDRRRYVQSLITDSPAFSKNMHFMQPEMITYKGISMVTNTLSAMTIALENDPDWDYFINLSGADYPLISPDDQARILARPGVPLGRLNFISFFNLTEWQPYSFRIRNLHWDPAVSGYQSNKSVLHYIRGRKTNPFETHRNFTFTKAEAWLILSRPFVKFLVRSAFAKRMLLNHIHVLSVPEHYFGDVLYNHPFWNGTIVPDAFRTVFWYLHGHRSGQHPYILDKDKSMSTFWKELKQQKSFFARKISKPKSDLIDRIDSELSGVSEPSGSEEKIQQLHENRQTFLQAIVDRFDLLTQQALTRQGVTWPSSAYR